MMLKCYLFVIFCVIQVRADNVLDELRKKTHENTLKYNQEFEKQKQNNTNIDYLRGLHGKLIQGLSNNNYEEPKCDKGDLQKMVETLRKEIEERKNEKDNLQKMIKTLQKEVDEERKTKEDLQKKVEEQEKTIEKLKTEEVNNENQEENHNSNALRPNQAPPHI